MKNLSSKAAVAALAILMLAGCHHRTKPQDPLIPDPITVREYYPTYTVLPRPIELDMLEVDFHVITETEDCHPVVEVLDDGQFKTNRFLNDPELQVKDPDGNPVFMCGNLHNKKIQIRSETGTGEFVAIAMTPNQYYRWATNLAKIKKYVTDTESLLTYYEDIINDLNAKAAAAKADDATAVDNDTE